MGQGATLTTRKWATLTGVQIAVEGHVYNVDFLRMIGRKTARRLDRNHPDLQGHLPKIEADEKFFNALTAFDDLLTKLAFENFVSDMRKVPSKESVIFYNIYEHEDAPESYKGGHVAVSLTGKQLRTATFSMVRYQPYDL